MHPCGQTIHEQSARLVVDWFLVLWVKGLSVLTCSSPAVGSARKLQKPRPR